MKIRIISAILLFAAFGCQQENKRTDAGNPQHVNKMQSRVERFDQFSRRFFLDSLFQMERIVFPLESDCQIPRSKNEHEEVSDNNRGKENWILLRNNYFLSSEPTIVINGVVYKKKVLKTKSTVEESIFIEDSGFATTLKFSLKNGKWYLVDYIECDD